MFAQSAQRLFVPESMRYVRQSESPTSSLIKPSDNWQSVSSERYRNLLTVYLAASFTCIPSGNLDCIHALIVGGGNDDGAINSQFYFSIRKQVGELQGYSYLSFLQT